jgi:predicted dehydrogenase
MKSFPINRRSFLKTTALASAGTIMVPTVLSSCSKDANSRIQVAHIGVGARGTATTKGYFLPVPDSRSLATCDAFTNRREDLAKEISAFYKEKYQEEITCTPYLDFHEILERSDIDAVHISTGDHWHLPIAIKAAKAGKHIYLEKPLGLSFSQMIELEDIMKGKNLIFQYGTQQRSLWHVKKGIEMIKAGEIGEITKIDIWAPPADATPNGSVANEEPPANLDYDRWLGPAPVKPYCPARVANTGSWNIYDYALGFIAGWGAHPLDVAVFGAKKQMTDTFTITGSGSVFPDNPLFDTINFWDLNLDYNNGLQIHYVSTNYAEEMMKNLKSGDGTTFYGTKGWISLGRGAAASDIPKLHHELNFEVFGENNRHGYNFIQSLKGEITPFNPLDEAILSDCISHMGNMLIRSGKDKIIWDAVNREIVNYPELKALYFQRESRAPYDV